MASNSLQNKPEIFFKLRAILYCYHNGRPRLTGKKALPSRQNGE